MFHFTMPPTEYQGRCYFKDNDIKFEPPVFEQRYMAVLQILELEQWSDQIKKVVEFGCAEMRFLFPLKRLNLEHIIEHANHIVICNQPHYKTRKKRNKPSRSNKNDMEMIEDVCNNLLTNDFETSNTFDISVLASTITKTDQLINKIKEQSNENVNLKQKLQSLNESAIQITNFYTMEKEKCAKIDRDNQLMHKRIESLEEQLLLLENKIVNDAGIHQQIVADFERRLDDQSQYLTLCKSFIAQGNILMANNLCTNPLSRQYNNVKDYLKKRGEYVEDAPTIKARRKTIAPKTSSFGTMTDNVEEIATAALMMLPEKTFSDKCIMHMPSTATRGTTTKVFIQTQDIATNFPEPISVEQIFKQTICTVPKLIPEINEFKWPTCNAETQTPDNNDKVSQDDDLEDDNDLEKMPPQIGIVEKPITKSIGTITGIKNVRRKINYIRKIKDNLLRNCDELYTIKKEEDGSPMGSMANLSSIVDSVNTTVNTNSNNIVSGSAMANNSLGLPINPQLSELWQILGQTIFSIVGTGRIFDQSSNLHLINENLSQIRSVLNAQKNDCDRGGMVTVGNSDGTQQSDGTLLQSTVNELRDTVLDFKDNNNGSNNKNHSNSCKSDMLINEQCVNDDNFDEKKQQQQQPNIISDSDGGTSDIDDGDQNDVDIEPDDELDDDFRANSPIISTNSQLNDEIDKSLTDDTTADINTISSNLDLKSQIFEEVLHNYNHPKNITRHGSPLLLNENNSKCINDQIVNSILPQEQPQNVPIVYPDSVFKVPSIPAARRSIKRIATSSSSSISQQILSPSHHQEMSNKHRRRSSDNNRSKRRRLEHIQFVRSATPIESSSQIIVKQSKQLVDISFIKSYFKVPELIEPIDELVLVDHKESGNEDAERYNRLMENCLQDLMLSDSDSDSEDSNLVIDENISNLSTIKSLQQTFDTERAVQQVIVEQLPVVEEEEIQPAIISDNSLSSYSPKSPTHSESLNEWCTQPFDIPISTKYVPKVYIFRHLLQAYDINKRNTIINAANNPETNIDARLLGRCRRLIEIYLTNEWTSINLKICYTKLLKLCENHYRIITMALIEIIEDNDEPIDMAHTPPAPAMSTCHQRIVVLISKITELLPGFDQLCISQIERTLFNFKSKSTEMISIVLNLTYLYLALTDMNLTDGSSCKIQSFLYKSLYYMNHMATPVIYVTLLAHPNCIPKFNYINNNHDNREFEDPHCLLNNDQYDSLTLTLFTIITNLSLYVPSEKEALFRYYRKKELSILLKNYYNTSPTVRITYDEIVQYLIDKLLNGFALKNISYSLILIAKRNGCEWATKHIIDKHLIPNLRKFLINANISNEYDKQIIILLFTFSSIIKAQPITDDIGGYQQMFGTILNKIDRQPIQEAAVESLLRTARFSATNVYQRICYWSPMYTINRKLHCMLQTFMHRKPLSFWEN